MAFRILKIKSCIIFLVKYFVFVLNLTPSIEVHNSDDQLIYILINILYIMIDALFLCQLDMNIE